MKANRMAVFRRIWPYVRQSKWSVFALLLSGVLIVPVSLVSPRFFEILVDDVIDKFMLEQFRVVVFGLLAVYVCRLAIDAVNLYCGNRLLNRFTLTIRTQVWNGYWNARYADYERMETGDLKMRLIDDVDSLGSFVQQQVAEYFSHCLIVVCTLCVSLRMHTAMTLCCLTTVPVVFLLNYLIGRGTQRVNEEIRRVNESYYTSTHNSLQFWREIKAQGAEMDFINRFRHYRRQLASLGYRSIRYWMYAEVLNDFKANYLTRVLVYIIGAVFVIHGEFSVGVLIVFSEYFSLLFASLDAINTRNVTLKTNAPYYRRVFETLSFGGEHTGDRRVPDGGLSLQTQSLEYGYQPERIVLRDVGVSIRAGEYTAVIGPSGCGKTTLAKLLLGLYEPSGGEVQCGGIPMGELDKEDYYRRIGVVLQDNGLFDMSIRENLLLAKQDADDETMLSACRRADILEFVLSLPQGLNTVIGERGIKLSGGQKQRLVIAQALLREPDLMIFDEATSSLDRETEQAILASINRIAGQVTVLLISHKPDTVMKADRVIVMDDGRVAAAGTHEELIEHNGFYRRMAEVNAL